MHMWSACPDLGSATDAYEALEHGCRSVLAKSGKAATLVVVTRQSQAVLPGQSSVNFTSAPV
jgi:hypothetical protein